MDINTLTTSQLTFYDITDGEMMFSIFSQGLDEFGNTKLQAILTYKGEEIVDGIYQWYKYDSKDGEFSRLDECINNIINIPLDDLKEDDIYRCDFSYNSDIDNVAYSSFFNMNVRKTIYTSKPINGRYLTGDMWLVVDSDEMYECDGNIYDTQIDNSIRIYNTMLVANSDGNGQFKSSDWGYAFNYDKKIYNVEYNLSEQDKKTGTIETDISNLKHKVDWTSNGGITFQAYQNGEVGNFQSVLDSTQMVFKFKGQDVAWIGGDTVQGDGHPQLYAQDAEIVNELNVGGQATVTNQFTIKNNVNNNELIFTKESNGSFSILVKNSN